MTDESHDLDCDREWAADDEAAARLLGLATPRPGVAADRMVRIKSVVHGAWRATVRRRRRRRLAVGLAAVATIAMAARLAVERYPAPAAAPATIARVETVEGHVRRAGVVTSPGLQPNARVMRGDALETDATGRAALRFEDGSSIRVDHSSHVRFVSSSVIVLTVGALYVDSGLNGRGIEIRTPEGDVRDIGTQFEVYVRDKSLRVRVRTGAVELQRRGRLSSARAGTELSIVENRETTRAISPFGLEWEWSAALVPTFDIDGRPLASFIDHLCREQGWTVRYADDELARKVPMIILHGSVDRLPPRDALDVVLTTSGLQHQLNQGELLIYRSAVPQ